MWRRSSPWRWGLSFSENKTLGVHLPIKSGEGVFDSCVMFMFFLGVVPFCSVLSCSVLFCSVLFCSRSDLLLAGHEINLALNGKRVGVTSVTGFQWTL